MAATPSQGICCRTSETAATLLTEMYVFRPMNWIWSAAIASEPRSSMTLSLTWT